MISSTVKLGLFLARMYLVGTSDACLAENLAANDALASGVCVFDPASQDVECTEVAEVMLHSLYEDCHLWDNEE